ncbi:TIR domain-containing protein [Nevskia soli]|uniref:TIR domain-containing protein n=1 Tax=Nevskia soli TaxID=418856 RepID=UPI0009FC3659|nr:TIR domain-containing protein [Nevskia soli]
MADIRNVFISHIHEDDTSLGKLKDLLATKGVTIRDSSIHKGKFNEAKDPDYIKYGILSPLIDWAGTFICVISPQTRDSEWVNWEVEYAAKQGKHIIGIWSYGNQGCELPDALKDHADSIVSWNGNAIVNAIDGKDRWEHADGSLFDPVPLRRHPC